MARYLSSSPERTKRVRELHKQIAVEEGIELKPGVDPIYIDVYFAIYQDREAARRLDEEGLLLYDEQADEYVKNSRDDLPPMTYVPRAQRTR